MKKQFFRVKQLADQTFLKADKSEVLNHEELHIADQKIEYLRTAITAITKRIPVVQGNDTEKRMKKTIEYQLAQVFQEQGKKDQDGDSGLFQDVLRECGMIEQALAKDYADHENKVEDLVGKPFQELLENEFPSILKTKRALSKYILDKDSASNRYHATKKEALKEDMDEADTKVEQNRDLLAQEMFSLLARQNELASYILQLLKLQRGYHESALKNLEGIIPELERKIGDSAERRVFGVPLKEHLRITKRKIAFPIEFCVNLLEKFGMSEEGLFRVGGGVLRVKRLKAAIDSRCLCRVIPEYRDPHILANILKLYLRELPEPLLTFELHNKWMQSMHYPEEHRLQVVKNLIAQLPQEHRDNLAYLIQFLAKISRNPENKMNSSNIAIVFAPNLLWDKNEESNMNMGNCATVNMLVEMFIKNVDDIFPHPVTDFVDLPPYLLQDDDEDNSNKTINFNKEFNNVDLSISMESIHLDNPRDSPKPNSRKKKPAAPVPPTNLSKTDQDISNEKNHFASSYPSGSTTLTRPQKPKDPTKVKTSVGTNTDEEMITIQRRSSFSRSNETHKSSEPKVTNLVNVDVKNSGQTIKIKQPQQQQSTLAQNLNCDKNFKTTVTHQIYQTNDDKDQKNNKPIAAPRSLILVDSERNIVSRTPSMKGDLMSKSESEILNDVILRRPDALERIHHKPEVPARPASLMKRASIDSHLDTTVHKTQCSYSSVANKQQPSIVNLQNRNEKYQPGHDNQIAEKEKFLGHQPDKSSVIVANPRASFENKFGDVNSNVMLTTTATINKAGLPPKMPEKLNKSSEKLNITMKSNEKLNENSEKFNGNQKPSHTRTRSDGNLVDLTDGNPHQGQHTHSLVQTPPSPRSLNKPTQPPPPPPVNFVKTKSDSDSTDL